MPELLVRVALAGRVLMSRCGYPRAGEQPQRRLWECRACGHQTSLTAGTVMHGTRTPLRVWFWAAYLVATHHPGISAVQHQAPAGHRPL